MDDKPFELAWTVTLCQKVLLNVRWIYVSFLKPVSAELDVEHTELYIHKEADFV